MASHGVHDPGLPPKVKFQGDLGVELVDGREHVERDLIFGQDAGPHPHVPQVVRHGGGGAGVLDLKKTEGRVGKRAG